MKMKRLLSSLLAITMMLTQLPLTVFADGDVPATTEEMQIASYVPEETELPDNDELFAGYVDKMFYGGIATYGTLAREHLKTKLEKRLYDLLKAEIEKIACGQRSSTEITIQMSQLQSAAVSDAYSEFSSLDSGELMQALLADCPYELYWFDKTTGWSYSWNSSKVTYFIHVANNYQGAGDFVVSSNVAALSTAVTNAKNIVSENAGKTDYRKLLAYKNKICSLVEYNFDAAAAGNFFQNDDPWQLIHVFDGDPNTKVVCEGYSKAMQYLCDMSTFNGNVLCYSVSGYMNGGAHMWNIVNIGGRNYLLDVTNSDAGTSGADGRYFLAGASGSAASGYTIKGTSFVYRDKTIALWGIDALTLSGSNYTEPAVDNISIADAVVSLSQTEYVYDGTAKVPTVTVSKNGVNLVNNVNYTVSYSNNINAGTATVTVNGTGNYYGTCYKTFTIKKAVPVISELVCEQELTTDHSINDVVVKGSASTDGTLYFDEHQVLKAGTYPYTYTFVPIDTNNYETITGSMMLTVKEAGCDHWLIELPAKAATCTEEGLTQGWYCFVCGEVTTPQEAIPALGHQLKILEGKAVTCMKDGLTQGSVCTVCGKVIVEQEVIKATGHSYINGQCTLCGKSEAIADGTCGSNLVWELGKDRTLTISGNGKMLDYKFDSNAAPWNHLRNLIERVVIEDGVTTIGDSAFYGCNLLEEVVFSNGVTSIGENAFRGCASLVEVVLPESLIGIDDYAFKDCKGLTEITLPDSVKNINYAVFESCTSLKKATLSDGLTTIDSSIFKDCSVLVEVVLPNNLKTIGSSVFYNCTSLEKVVLPDSLTQIGSTAFYMCTSLKEIKLPNNISQLGYSAFSWCASLKEIVLPNSLFTIERQTFLGCESLEKVTIPNSVTWIEYSAFDDCNALTDVYYNGTQKEWNAIIVGEDNELLLNANIHFVDGCTHPQTKIIQGKAATCTVSGLTEGKQCSICGEVTTPQEAIPALGHSAGSGIIEKAPTCTEDGLKKTFCGYCNELMSTEVMPATGHNYLYGICTVCGMGEDIIASGICGNNAEWVLDIDGTLSITGSGAMYNYKLSSNVAPWKAYANQVKCIMIEEGITTVGDCTFVGCSNANELVIPDSINYIGGYAFDGCGKLTEIMLPEAVESIGCGAFRNCSALKEIYLPKAIECSVMYDDIQYDTFAGCTSLTDVCFGGTAADWANISINANGNDSLLNAKIHIGKKYSTDPDPELGGTFDGYKWSLADGTLTISGSGWTNGFICDNVQITIPWYGLEIENIVIEEGVTMIGCNAFNHCGNIQSLTLPKSLTYIDGFAFNDCTPAKIYYNGSAVDFSKINIGECNDGIVEEKVVFGEVAKVTYTPYINGQPVTGMIEGTVGDTIELYVLDSNGKKYMVASSKCTGVGEIYTAGKMEYEYVQKGTCIFEIMDLMDQAYNIQALSEVIVINFNIKEAPKPVENFGEVNGDGSVNNIDAMLVLQYAVGLIDDGAINAASADVNGDGSVNNIDAMLILQYAVGLIEKFPAANK